MKTVCLFVACFLAVALAVDVEHGVRLRKAFTECKKEMGIVVSNNPDILDSASDAGVSDDKKPCFYFCLLKKFKLMNEDGTVNKDAMVDTYKSPSEKERVSKNIDNCIKTTKPGDGCQMGQCLYDVE